MNNHEYFDVPLCRVQAAGSLFPKNQEAPVEKQQLDENLVTRPQIHVNNQVKFRSIFILIAIRVWSHFLVIRKLSGEGGSSS